MYSLRHVFWRGAMALSLLALGIGGGFGFQQEPLQAKTRAPACDDDGRHVIQIPGTVVDEHALAAAVDARASIRRG